jgi:hypothetical protein
MIGSGIRSFMVKIIKDNSIRYYITCPHCKSILQFKSYDIRVGNKINCPACFRDVRLSENREKLYKLGGISDNGKEMF